MKKKALFFKFRLSARISLILIALCTFFLFSCSKEEDLDDVENIVTFKVTSDSSDVPFEISATDGYTFKTKGKWEKNDCHQELFC